MFLTRNAFRRLHYPIDIIDQCVRWHLAYALSLRNLEEMIAECGIVVDRHNKLQAYQQYLADTPFSPHGFS